jgi:hypothetical protein
MSAGRKLSRLVNVLEFVGKTVRIWNSEYTRSGLCPSTFFILMARYSWL